MKSLSTFLFFSIFLFSCHRRIHVYDDYVKHEKIVSYVLPRTAKCVNKSTWLGNGLGKYFSTILVFEKDALADKNPVLYLRLSYEVDNSFYMVIDGAAHEFQLGDADENEELETKPEPSSLGGDIAIGVLEGVVGVEVVGHHNVSIYDDLYLEFDYEMDKELREEILQAKKLSFRYYINRLPYEYTIKGRKLRRIKKFLLY